MSIATAGPQWLPAGLSGGIGVERGERREIARADRPSACPVFEQPGKLRPIGRFKSKIFARDHRTGIGQCAPCHAHVILQLRRRIGVDQQREVMIAERESVGFEIVERVRELVDLRGGRILSRDQLVLLARQDRLGVGLRQKREGLRDDELKRRGKQRVQQARPGGRRIFLESEHASEARSAGTADFQSFAAEDDTV